MIIILDCVHYDRDKTICIKELKKCMEILKQEYKCIKIDHYTKKQCKNLTQQIINNKWSVIISGSWMQANDNTEWLNNLREMIIKLINKDIKILGTCFGGQFIFNLLYPNNFKTKKYPEHEPITLQLDGEITQVAQNHKDAMIYSDNLDKIDILSTNIVNNTKIIQMFKIKNKNVWGTQFHPEKPPRYLKIFKLIV